MGSKTAKGETLQVDDLRKEFMAGFSDALKERFKQAATQLVDIQDYETGYGDVKDHSDPHSNAEMDIDYELKLYLVKYIGCRATKKYRVNCVKKVVDVLEDLESKGYIHKFLAPLIGIPFIDNEYGVVSYPSLTDEGVKYLETTYPEFNFEEGGTPVDIKEL